LRHLADKDAENAFAAGFGTCRANARSEQKFFASFFKKEVLPLLSKQPSRRVGIRRSIPRPDP
jgi:hypothetical protein